MSAEFVDGRHGSPVGNPGGVEAPSASLAGQPGGGRFNGRSGVPPFPAGRGVHDASGRGRVVAASAAPEGGGVARHNPIPRHVSFKWCDRCNTRDRLHVRGVCDTCKRQGMA